MTHLVDQVLRQDWDGRLVVTGARLEPDCELFARHLAAVADIHVGKVCVQVERRIELDPGKLLADLRGQQPHLLHVQRPAPVRIHHTKHIGDRPPELAAVGVLLEPPPLLKRVEPDSPGHIWIHPVEGLLQHGRRQPVTELPAQRLDLLELQVPAAVRVSLVEQPPHPRRLRNCVGPSAGRFAHCTR
eukprot:SAG22_NODE_4357_length_1293_cov_1.242044_3_plen_186_part_01